MKVTKFRGSISGHCRLPLHRPVVSFAVFQVALCKQLLLFFFKSDIYNNPSCRWTTIALTSCTVIKADVFRRGRQFEYFLLSLCLLLISQGLCSCVCVSRIKFVQQWNAANWILSSEFDVLIAPGHKKSIFIIKQEVFFFFNEILDSLTTCHIIVGWEFPPKSQFCTDLYKIVLLYCRETSFDTCSLLSGVDQADKPLPPTAGYI